MKVLVVGGGGREHALAWKIKQSPLLTELYCAPGNAGTASLGTNVELDPENIGVLALWAVENKIDLTVVGPEAPLAAGLVDVFTEHGLKVFGPTKAAARIESSKSFAKEIMEKAGVRTPRGQVLTDFKEAETYLKSLGSYPVVIKADGLAAGKGVIIAKEEETAVQALKDCLEGARFGEAGEKVIIEEFITGREASVMALIDGDTVLPCVVSQDYKRLLDNDEGPNTGGMGSISPTPVLQEIQLESLITEIFLPVIRELNNQGIRYRGFLYAGVIVDTDGTVQVLEYNARLGDPETQVLMMRLESDLLGVLDKAVSGNLGMAELRWRPEAAACVVAASEGYPSKVNDGKEISGLFPGDETLTVFHAGTRVSEGDPEKIVSKGGRVLSVTGLGRSSNEALRSVYRGLEKISFEGMHFRKDIGGGAW